MDDFNYLIGVFIAKLIANFDIPTKVKKLRISAFKTIRSRLNAYKEHGYNISLLNTIAVKKGEMIMETSSKTEMEKVVKASCPNYNGNRFIPDKYNVPEEEMIGWSLASLRAPLNEAGFNRYMELFEQVYPEKYKEIHDSKSSIPVDRGYYFFFLRQEEQK